MSLAELGIELRELQEVFRAPLLDGRQRRRRLVGIAPRIAQLGKQS